MAMIPAVGGIAEWFSIEKQVECGRDFFLHSMKSIKAPTLLMVGLKDRTTVGLGRVPEYILKDKGRYDLSGKAAAKDIPN